MTISKISHITLDPHPRSRHSHRNRPFVGALLAMALLAAACGGDDDTSGRDGRIEPGIDKSTTEGEKTESEDPGDRPDPGDGFPPVSDPPDDGSLDNVKLTLTEIADLDSPIALTSRAGTKNLYVAERAGRIRVLEVNDSGRIREAADSLLNISDDVSTEGEQGLLGIVFSSDGRTLYVSYTDPEGDSRLVQYSMNRDRVDAQSRRELLVVEQPYSNHNGGDVRIGPDGFLYYGLGDGGAADDPDNRSADPEELLGKILRIDPDAGTDEEPYAIPDGNPYAEGGGRPEIFLSGVRNPWRFTFDSATGGLWIADVGQNEIEEINHLPAGDGEGADLGWSGYEGTAVHIEDRVRAGTVPPVYEYLHSSGGCSVTGGEVYRGIAIPDLVASYVFGDFCDGKIRAVKLGEDGEVVAFRELGVETPSLVSINTGPDGFLYAVSLDGPVYRLDPQT